MKEIIKTGRRGNLKSSRIWKSFNYEKYFNFCFSNDLTHLKFSPLLYRIVIVIFFKSENILEIIMKIFQCSVRKQDHPPAQQTVRWTLLSTAPVSHQIQNIFWKLQNNPVRAFSVPIIMSSIVCPFIMHKLSNCLFFQTDQCQQDRVHQARHFLGTCISQPFVSFHSEYISLLQVFSDENFWSFPRKIGFLKCELSYLLFMMYLQSGSNVHWKYKPSDMWYDMKCLI